MSSNYTERILSKTVSKQEAESIEQNDYDNGSVVMAVAAVAAVRG